MLVTTLTTIGLGTMAHAGHKLAIHSLGKGVISAPIIETEISTGQVMIPIPASATDRDAEAKALAEQLRCKP